MLAGSLNDGALSTTGVGRQAENLDHGLLMRLRPGGLPDMHASAIAALQCGGDALLRGELLTHRVPFIVDALGREWQAQGMHEMVGQHADEQMPPPPGVAPGGRPAAGPDRS